MSALAPALLAASAKPAIRKAKRRFVIIARPQVRRRRAQLRARPNLRRIGAHGKAAQNCYARRMTFAPDYPLARVIPSPNHGERLRPISLLILHYTGMPTASSALDLLRSPQAEVSAHYFVEEDGGVLQLVPEARRAWHAGKSFWAGETDVNSASIGVEIAHPGHDDPRPYPLQQIAAVAALARDICERRAIARERVLAHSDIAVTRKIDPGEFFPWEALALEGVGHYVAPARLGAEEGLTIGDAGAEVAALQEALRAYGYDIAPTGRYDEATANVVAAFQRHFRPQRIDGRADASTRATLEGLLGGLRKGA
jgi:N-acetyl-anhydromuramyl-L-alanine amidase AmpD